MNNPHEFTSAVDSMDVETPRTSAIDAFVQQGYCVFDSPFSVEEISALRRAYMSLLNEKIRRFGVHAAQPEAPLLEGNAAVLNDFKPNGGNHDLNRWNMHLPSNGALFDERLFNDPRIIELVDTLIGPDAVCYLMASDTPFPDAGYQGAHQDFTRFSIALNIPLVDVHEDNGPTEIWPATHRDGAFHTETHFIPEHVARTLSQTREPTRLTVPAGTFIVRDHRLLHRGTANRSREPRPMLSFYYTRAGQAPYGWLAKIGVYAALRIRRAGRGARGDIANQRVLNLGNLLGRIVEESMRSDRDYRRPIVQHTWQTLSPRAQHLLRYAHVASQGSRTPRSHALQPGSFEGAHAFLKRYFRAALSFAMHEFKRTPRKPD